MAEKNVTHLGKSDGFVIQVFYLYYAVADPGFSREERHSKDGCANLLI